MKTIIAALALTSALVVPAAAEVTAKISEVHLCCKSCVTGVEKAVADLPDVKAAADMESGTVTLTGPDKAAVQKGADALVKAGYFGKCGDGVVKLDAATGAKGQKVQTLKIEGVHLCCPKCVKAVDRAIKNVPGAKEHTATKGAKSFEVTGDFDDKEMLSALQKEGLTGKVAK
jgi:copper chaperone CopZ